MSPGENSSLLGISSNSWGAFSKSFDLLHAASIPAGTEGFRAPSRSFSDRSLGDGGDKTRRPLWELGFFRPTTMDASELDSTQAQIADLHAELDIERIARRKLTKELSDERRARKSAEHACDGLARENGRNEERVRGREEDAEDVRGIERSKGFKFRTK